MRVAVTGATGNVGTSVLAALGAEPRVEAVTGIARRVPAGPPPPKVTWAGADIARDPLEPLLRGTDALIHLAWLIQPSRDEARTHEVNVTGSQRVFEAAAQAGVRTVVHASSVGAYAAGPKDRRVDESWPTTGIPTSFYSRHKAAVERILDAFEATHEAVRVVRLRPGLIFKGEAASEIRRLFAGPFLPRALVRRGLVPIVPRTPGLAFQAVHSDDVARAYRLALVDETARGAYNVAAEPVLDADALGRLLDARPVPVPAAVLRAAAALTWRARLQPTEPGWVDMGLGVPLMDISRAHDELGWTPRHAAGEAFMELFDGLRRGTGGATPPLAPGTGGPARLREMAQGIGARNEP
ncbi:MAG: NAD-dependent epimerase/dehydratase family protein [Actinomycetota bacterium]|nr:NAD-dependent epimerase/dehydratase family protein [Actinomycetota bacterium]